MSFAVPSADARAFVQLLAADLTWTLLAVLQRGDARPDELSVATGQPLTTISPALEQLAAIGAVASRASDADSAHVYYQLREPEAQRRAFTRTITELAQRIRSLLVFIERDQRTVLEEVS